MVLTAELCRSLCYGGQSFLIHYNFRGLNNFLSFTPCRISSACWDFSVTQGIRP